MRMVRIDGNMKFFYIHTVLSLWPIFNSSYQIMWLVSVNLMSYNPPDITVHSCSMHTLATAGTVSSCTASRPTMERANSYEITCFALPLKCMKPVIRRNCDHRTCHCTIVLEIALCSPAADVKSPQHNTGYIVSAPTLVACSETTVIPSRVDDD
jgi:hypothetical protein